MTFLTGLELTRRRLLFLRQARPFSELWIYRRDEEDEEPQADETDAIEDDAATSDAGEPDGAEDAAPLQPAETDDALVADASENSDAEDPESDEDFNRIRGQTAQEGTDE